MRGPQSALYGSDAIGGVIHVITRSGGTPSAQAQIETGSRDMLRASGATTGEVNGVRWQLGANYFEDAGFTGTAANGQTVSNDDAQETQASASIGWRHATRGLGPARPRCSTSIPSADRRARMDRIPRIAMPASTRSPAAPRSASAAACAYMQPWFGASSRVRQRVEFDVADYDLELQEPVRRVGWQHASRSHARVQTDVSANAAVRILRRLRVARRARRQHVHHLRSERRRRRRSSAACWASSARPAGTRAIARPSPPAFAASASRATRCPAIRSRSSRVPTFRKRRSTRSTRRSPRRSASGEGTPPARLVRHRHPSARCVRDRLHRQFGTEARAQQERRVRRDADVRRRRRADRRDGVLQFLHRPDHLGRPHVLRRRAAIAPTTSRTRAPAAPSCRRRGAATPASASARNYTFLDTEILAVNGSSSAQTPYAVGDPLLRRPRHSGAIDASFTRDRVSAFAELQMRGETLDAEPAFGPTGGLYTERRLHRLQSRRIVAAGEGARSLRARAEPLRSRLRRSAGLSGAGPDGLRGCPRCCGQITFRSGMRRARRWWWTVSPSASLMVRSPASSARTDPARPRCCVC